MVSKALEVIKPVLGAVGLIIILQVSGVLGSVTYVAQSAVMKTGLLDANVGLPPKENKDFDFDFAIKDLHGNQLAFDQFRGKVIFLNLWATWCGPCRAEMPTIQALYDKVLKDNLVFVMISLDKDQDLGKIISYIQRRNYTFPVYQRSGHLSEQLKVPSIPTTFVISKDGKIVFKEVGTSNFDTSKFRKFLETEAMR